MKFTGIEFLFLNRVIIFIDARRVPFLYRLEVVEDVKQMDLKMEDKAM